MHYNAEEIVQALKVNISYIIKCAHSTEERLHMLFRCFQSHDMGACVYTVCAPDFVVVDVHPLLCHCLHVHSEHSKMLDVRNVVQLITNTGTAQQQLRQAHYTVCR